MDSENKTEFSLGGLFSQEVQDFWNLVCFAAKENKLSLESWEFIADTGTFNRVFRRWYQTNWLRKDWCPVFKGTTPKQFVEQKISKLSPSAVRSHYVSCYIDDESIIEKSKLALGVYQFPYSIHTSNQEIDYLPLMTAFEELEKVFTKGASISSTGYLNKIYTDHWRRYCFQDRDFLFWATRILWNQQLLKFIPSSRQKRGRAVLNSQGKAFFSLEPEHQLPSFIKYAVFAAAARIGSALLEGIKIKIDQEVSTSKTEELLGQFTAIFRDAVLSGEWVDVDALLFQCWDVVENLFPGQVLDSRAIFELPEKEDHYMKKDPFKTIITKDAFSRFASGFDYYFLFPFNWYFGLTECVWTTGDQFVQDLSIYFSLVKRLSGKNLVYSDDRRDFGFFCNVFFGPCTCFKFVDGLSAVQ